MYTRSNNIKVFPSSNRSKEFISYSGLNTEQNITSLVNRFTRGKSYVIDNSLDFTITEDITIKNDDRVIIKPNSEIIIEKYWTINLKNSQLTLPSTNKTIDLDFISNSTEYKQILLTDTTIKYKEKNTNTETIVYQNNS